MDFVHRPGIGRVGGEDIVEHLVDGFLEHRVDIVLDHTVMCSIVSGRKKSAETWLTRSVV